LRLTEPLKRERIQELQSAQRKLYNTPTVDSGAILWIIDGKLPHREWHSAFGVRKVDESHAIGRFGSNVLPSAVRTLKGCIPSTDKSSHGFVSFEVVEVVILRILQEGGGLNLRCLYMRITW
jgi:hypothetical protein